MGGSTFKQAWMVLTEYCEQFQRWGGSNPLDVLAESLRILLQTGFSFKIWIRLVISTFKEDLTIQFLFFFLEFQVELLETYKYNVYTLVTNYVKLSFLYNTAQTTPGPSQNMDYIP